MSLQEYNYLKKLIIGTCITIIIGNAGALIPFYYNTKNDIEVMQKTIESQQASIDELQQLKADNQQLKELADDLRNSILMFNNKIDNITNLLITMKK